MLHNILGGLGAILMAASGGVVLGEFSFGPAFYFAIGCEETKEIDQDLYQLDTRDYQMEFAFTDL